MASSSASSSALPAATAVPAALPRLVQVLDRTRATKGLVALANISAGTDILVERPTFTFEYGKNRAFHDGVDPLTYLSSLSPAEQVALARIPPKPGNNDLLSSRFHQCIGHFLESGGTDYVFLPTIGRAKHSCTPNVIKVKDDRSGKFLLRACRHIPEGSPVYLNYLHPFPRTHADRNRQLFNFRFGPCTCPACRLPPDERDASDARATLLVDWITGHTDPQTWSSFRTTDEVVGFLIEIVDVILECLTDQLLDLLLMDAVRVAARVCFKYDDVKSGIEWAKIETTLCNLQGIRAGIFDVSQRDSDGATALIAPPPSLRHYVKYLKTPPTPAYPPAYVFSHRPIRARPDPLPLSDNLLAPSSIPLGGPPSASSSSSSYAGSSTSGVSSDTLDDDPSGDHTDKDEIRQVRANQRRRAKVKAAKARKEAEMWLAGQK